ncbi:MAG: tRNA pseudouridine(55) synthase TruB [Byssovorax sp.]
MTKAEEPTGPHGVLVVDKPVGPTSHDCVGKARRKLGTRRVGHAGTLDPMASGVLVLLVGEGTKLGPYLTAHPKRYRARITFGVATDTLDREGQETASAAIPAWLRDELAAVARGEAPGSRLAEAFASELARTAQIPPAFSAIKIDGRRSYDRARKGEEIAMPEREVTLRAITAVGADAALDHPFLDVDLDVSKGYYVRSFARDLGARLDLPSHLGALRRTASGPFTLERAVALDDLQPGALVPVPTAACEALASGRLTNDGAIRAHHGKALSEADFVILPPPGEASAWLDPEGRLVAIGTRTASELVSHRGFRT